MLIGHDIAVSGNEEPRATANLSLFRAVLFLLRHAELETVGAEEVIEKIIAERIKLLIVLLNNRYILGDNNGNNRRTGFFHHVDNPRLFGRYVCLDGFISTQ